MSHPRFEAFKQKKTGQPSAPDKLEILNHPMFPTFARISMHMSEAAKDFDTTREEAQALIEMDKLAEKIYKEHFTEKRSKFHFSLFIGILIEILSSQ